MTLSGLVGALLIVAIMAATYKIVFLHSMARWGATPSEASATMPCDAYLQPMEKRQARFTRAIDIAAPPEAVWPWICQVGRGAGWYAYDWVDNSGRKSADLLVEWIPAPAVGDALAIGCLAEIKPGTELSYDGRMPSNILGSSMRMALTYRLEKSAYGTRLVARLNTDFKGPTAGLALRMFEIFDFLVAQRQMVKLKRYIEGYPKRIEGGPLVGDRRRSTYQRLEVIYADGSQAGESGAGSAAQRNKHLHEAGLAQQRQPRPNVTVERRNAGGS